MVNPFVLGDRCDRHGIFTLSLPGVPQADSNRTQ
jgi:hypothetical protein